jgi:hypothetical protein
MSKCSELYVYVHIYIIYIRDYSEVLLAPDQLHHTLKDHPLSAVHNYFLDTFSATLHVWRLSPSATREHAIPW